MRKTLPHWHSDNLSAALLLPFGGEWKTYTLLWEVPSRRFLRQTFPRQVRRS